MWGKVDPSSISRPLPIWHFQQSCTIFYLLLLSPDGGTLAGDGLETGFDGLYGTAGVTGHALQEEEPGLLVEDGVGAAASVTRHILFNIPENNHFLSTYYMK